MTPPAPVNTLLRALPPGWHHVVTPGQGIDQRGGLSETTDGDGKRSRITRTVDVESIALRAHHDDGRAVRVVWAREQGATTPTGKPKGYTFALAWRGRHDGEHAPAPLTATELKPYLLAAGPADALRAVDELRAEQARRAAARAAAKRAPVRELHPRVEQVEEVAA